MISGSYLLIVQIPCYKDKSGAVYMDQLWRMDFEKHFDYINDFTIACPQIEIDTPEGDMEKVQVPKNVNANFVPLNYKASFVGMCLAAPKLAVTLYKAIKKSDIVHSGIIGWPFPLGWIANPIALMLKKPLVIVVESVPWRDAAQNTSFAKRLRSRLSEVLAKYFVRRATVATFNQRHFKETLTKPGAPRHTLVSPTVWLDEKDILDEGEAEASWQLKSSADYPLKVVFAGRLVASKGVRLLLEALKILDKEKVDMEFNIIGDGDLFSECEEQIKNLSHIKLAVHTAVPYGNQFFEFIRSHHFAVLPCIVDEQPRIILDYYSQAIPVVGSDIPGLVHNLDEGKSGWLFQNENVDDLVSKIKIAIESRHALKEMGLYSLEKGKQYTHNKMHLARHQLIKEAIDSA